MAYNYEYPYTDAQRGNQDWIIHEIKTLREEYDLFVVMNEVTYAEPIEWSIDTQYAKNTIVQYDNGETTYLSKQPVPAGIQITNTDYWLRLADYAPAFNKMRAAIVAIDIEDVSIAPFDIPQGTHLFYRGLLYTANTYIYTGDTLRPNINLTQTNVEEWIDSLDTRLDDVENDVNTLTGQVSTATTDITTLFGQVGALQTKSNVLVKTGTFYAANWDGLGVYTITDSDITVTSIIVLCTPAGINATQLSELQDANIQPYAQSAGEIKVVAFGTLPTNDLPYQMLIYLN